MKVWLLAITINHSPYYSWLSTVYSCCRMDNYDMVFHTNCELDRQNIDQILNPKDAPCITSQSCFACVFSYQAVIIDISIISEYEFIWIIVHRLPKLVANISFQFHHLVNTGLDVGFFVKCLAINVAKPFWIDKFEWFIARRLQMVPYNCNHL